MGLILSRSDKDLPLPLYSQLVSGLHQTPRAVMVGSGCCIGSLGGLLAFRAQDIGLAALTILAVMCVLLGLLKRPRSLARASFKEVYYSEVVFWVAALGSSAAVGALSARAIIVSNLPIVHLLALALAMATMAVAQRNYHRPRLVAAQLLSVALPGAFALFSHGGLEYGVMAVGALVLTFMIWRTALAHCLDVQEGIRKDQALNAQNQRFDAALNNMAQGLCMFDGDGRLLVCNRKYIELYGFSDDVVRPGIEFIDLLRHSVEVGNHSVADFDPLHDKFVEKMVSCESSTFLNELNDGRTIALSHQVMSSGGWVTTHEDVTERRHAEARIAHMARHDALTDLPNRAFFQERLREALVRIPARKQVAVLCLDLDRFKPVNDTLGHSVGDSILQQVAERLKECVRENDSVARIGGDEFAIIQSATFQPEAGKALAERIVSALGEPFYVGNQQISIGASVGISLGPQDSLDANQLLVNADLALYQAKAQGRGRYSFFVPAMDQQMQARRELEEDLRRAVVNGEFEVFYQPVINTHNEKIASFEALLRWNHPSKGMILPGNFIAAAEDIGLIVPVGEWTLRQACLEAAAWPKNIGISVNLSPIQFRVGGDLVRSVADALVVSGIDPERLEFEITEGVLLDETLETQTILGELRKLGVRFALDDFGTGYSSLSYLRSFPFNRIKIDQSFIRDIDTRSHALSIIRAVADLGTNLGMSITAEGIETAEQLEHVRSEGCSQAQGYHVGLPMDAEATSRLLEKSFPADDREAA